MPTHRFLKKGDAVLLAVLAGAALLFCLFYRFLYPKAIAGVAVVTVNGALYGEYPLDTAHSFTIETADGGHNTVVIGDGCAAITDADCPDRLCVQRGRIDRSGQTVVCLPHGVVVTVRGGAESGVDN